MSIRHEFYETDEKVTISIFERGADPEKVKVDLTPTSLQFQYGEQSLTLSPLKGEIDPAASTYTVSKVKVEVKLQKAAEGRWGKLVKTSDDDKPGPPTGSRPANEPLFESRKQGKNWEKVTTDILGQDKDKTTNEDPNAGGDTALNGFFQQLYSGADEDSRRAMMKSFVESGGTTLSTNWDEVGKGPVEVKPPEGVEEVGSMKCCSRTKTYQDVGGGGGRWQGVVSCESGTSVTENVEPSGIMKTFTLNV